MIANPSPTSCIGLSTASSTTGGQKEELRYDANLFRTDILVALPNENRKNHNKTRQMCCV